MSDSKSLPTVPSGFKTIEEIQNLPNEDIKNQIKISVIGFVKDFQPPVPTRGTDHKCTIEIMDLSVQFESHGIKFNIFWVLENMPTCGARDLILIRNAKVQWRGGGLSLIANLGTAIHVIPASKIPSTISAASNAKWMSYPPNKHAPPKPVETQYGIQAKTHSKDLDIPSDHEFEENVKQAMNVKDKFSLLRDVKPDRFYNILGEVIKVHDVSSESMTVYLSDYTENSQFYNNASGADGADSEARDGDEFGYTKSKTKKTANSWPGPYGKRSIQLTLYDGHADFVRENVKVKQWVLLSNVQIKYGKMGGVLEGYLRGDRGAFEGQVRVQIMEQAEKSEDNDDRWREAVQRRLEYEQKQQKQKLGDKRKHDDAEPKNSKERRNAKRAATEKKVAELARKAKEKLYLNENIKCAFPDEPVISLAEILKPQTISISKENEEHMSLPFTVCKYRANVRVVDYFPPKLEDFAIGRRSSVFDMLPDYSGGEDTDLEEDRRIFKSGKGFPKDIWEWRFALLVEDANSKDAKERLWLIVDNHAAQGLLGLEDDATNLRDNSRLTAELREQLFKLWGDLEEKKSAMLPKQSTKAKKGPPPSSFDSIASSPLRKAGAQPDADSDVENESSIPRSGTKMSTPAVLQERDSNIVSTITGTDAQAGAGLAPKNKAFTCCIKQYGVKVDEEDPAKANAGQGQRWQRMFGLFGTQIM